MRAVLGNTAHILHDADAELSQHSPVKSILCHIYVAMDGQVRRIVPYPTDRRRIQRYMTLPLREQ